MAPVKRRPHARSHHKMKHHRHKQNIPELVYKFLSLANQESRDSESHSWDGTCRFCGHQKRRGEVLNSANVRRSGGKSMANKQRKNNTRNPKTHGVKRRRTPREQPLSSCMHTYSRSEGVKKVKKYIQKALDFGVESGYLIPKDTSGKVFRVSSEILGDDSSKSKVRTVSQERGRSPHRTPSRYDDDQVQEARNRNRLKRRRGRKRSRSNSRKRRRSRRQTRRRSGSQNPEETAGNDDYETDNDDEKRRDTRDKNEDRDPENSQLNTTDGEKMVKKEEDGSDLSVDEEETDEEEEKKRDDDAKS